MPRESRERPRRETENCNDTVGVLRTPGPDITRRPANATSKLSRGSQRNAIEIFNIQHAAWAGKECDEEYSALSAAQARAVRRKIRKALYAADGEFQLQKGKHMYREVVKTHGQKLYSLRKKLDSAFAILSMAEGSWASDMFVQEVLKTDRTYKKASRTWVHPRNQSIRTARRNQEPSTPARPSSQSSAEQVREASEDSDASRDGDNVYSTDDGHTNHGEDSHDIGIEGSDHEEECQPRKIRSRANLQRRQGNTENTSEISRMKTKSTKRRPARRRVHNSDESDDQYEKYLTERLEGIRKKRRRKRMRSPSI